MAPGVSPKGLVGKGSGTVRARLAGIIILQKKSLKTLNSSKCCFNKCTGDNFPKEIPLNEISEKLKFLFKKVKWVNFPKEISLNEISQISKNWRKS